MRHLLSRLECVGAALLATVLVSAPALAVDSFTATYQGGSSNTCGTTYNLVGREPTEAGRYPLFLYMVGTSESYNNAAAIAAIESMAAKGYVAATVQYASSSFGDCSAISAKTRCIFTSNTQVSAVSVLCARAKADCSRGIVVAGFSQGSIIAMLARNYDSRVEAAYGLGAGVRYSFYDLSSCVADGKRTLSSSRLRVVNGEVDSFLGGNLSAVRDQTQQLTGRYCPSATSCLAADGSGWYIVRGAEVSDGTADHCYWRSSGGCNGSQNTADAKWKSGTGAWALEANLQWLTGFTR